MSARFDRTPREQDLAGIGLVHAGKDLDQRRLAGAVLAEKRMDLAAADVEIDVVERPRRGEPLDEALDDEERLLAFVTGMAIGSMLNTLGLRPLDKLEACTSSLQTPARAA